MNILNMDYHMSTEKEQKNLFECLPLDNNGINKFKNFIKNNPLEKRFFYEKNEQEQTFIQVLLNLGMPKTVEEGHIRVHLLYNFHMDSSNSLLLSKDLLENLRLEYITNIYKKYDVHMASIGNQPKFNLNEYFKQIRSVLEDAGTRESATKNIGNILKDYFTDFNSQM